MILTMNLEVLYRISKMSKFLTYLDFPQKLNHNIDSDRQALLAKLA